MIFSYRTHKKITIQKGNAVVIGTNNQSVYLDLINGLNGDMDLVNFFDKDYNMLDNSKNIDWVGDLLESIDVNQKYKNKLINNISNHLNEKEINSVHEANRKLFNTIQSHLFMYDLPIEVEYDNDLKRIFKYSKIHFDNFSINNPYDKIKILIKLHLELKDSSVLAVTNVAHYLTPEQIGGIADLCKSASIPLIMIEFTDLQSKDTYKHCNFAYIDQDFVDWY
ncbi:type II-A CRISPR-associated protein Csn2 [Apilactobacillus apisilvae]|uniref:Type II-A CRISPR-associated protein Csn2 n=1 Tax=Apilactobacillus apisilvae TaxID=2923364 RepID=A0ABY4PGT9_9LACO|nr:type II-A CRISPR-associated protein Csn2 [Apilactobacillus apisilvae]UQS84797.1 type II-A CRISPR-associated protein Csn2 [Apilactobacillus apisilvae]